MSHNPGQKEIMCRSYVYCRHNCTYVYLNNNMCIQICIYINIYVCAHICIYVNIHMNVYMYTYTRIELGEYIHTKL
jgi:hypothetical protein